MGAQGSPGRRTAARMVPLRSAAPGGCTVCTRCAPGPSSRSHIRRSEWLPCCTTTSKIAAGQSGFLLSWAVCGPSGVLFPQWKGTPDGPSSLAHSGAEHRPHASPMLAPTRPFPCTLAPSPARIAERCRPLRGRTHSGELGSEGTNHSRSHLFVGACHIAGHSLAKPLGEIQDHGRRRPPNVPDLTDRVIREQLVPTAG